MAEGRSSRGGGELRRSSQLTRRTASCTCATKALSFIALNSPAPPSKAAPAPEAASSVVPKTRPHDAPQWGAGVGWKKLSERGKLIMSPSSGGCLTVEGCTVGFCVASYEGTKEEEAILNGGKYAVEALVRVSPGGVFDGQAMCVVFDMAKASDVSGACHFCSLQLNTSTSRSIAIRRIGLALAAASAAGAQRVGRGNRCLLSAFVRRSEGDPGGVDTQEAELTRMVEREMLVAPPPRIRLHDVVALNAAKEMLTEIVLLPLQMPGLLTGLLEPPKGVLLFGPPGTGKTMLATALASVAEVSFFSCSAASLTSKWRGESEKLLRALFKIAKARAPSLIFIDEADALCSQRGKEDEHEASRRFKAELLQQMDGLGTFLLEPPPETATRVVVVAATNAPWDIDEALRRRLEKRVLLPLPDLSARQQLLHHLLNQQQARFSLHTTKHKLPANACIRTANFLSTSLVAELLSAFTTCLLVDSGLDLGNLARRTEGFSCADLRSLCREAAMQPMRRLLRGAPPEALLRGALKPDDASRVEQACMFTQI
ncbi:hypothetical protein ACSSS7_002336 [Eimeria intestinalis]